MIIVRTQLTSSYYDNNPYQRQKYKRQEEMKQESNKGVFQNLLDIEIDKLKQKDKQ